MKKKKTTIRIAQKKDSPPVFIEAEEVFFEEAGELRFFVHETWVLNNKDDKYTVTEYSSGMVMAFNKTKASAIKLAHDKLKKYGWKFTMDLAKKTMKEEGIPYPLNPNMNLVN